MQSCRPVSTGQLASTHCEKELRSKFRIISELEEVTILGYTVPLHVRRKAAALQSSFFFVQRSVAWSRRDYWSLFGKPDPWDYTVGNEDTSDNVIGPMR